MTKRKQLSQAMKNKKDEFYTQLYDIENELKHYVKHFKNKTILCNCDDPKYSNFYFFFKEQFNWYGLKKLITTHYVNPNVENHVGGGCSYKIEIICKNGTLQEIKTPLKENGDFRSQECIELLKESDIVVTNPPFSLFREYVDQLIEYNKKFLIVGHQNAIAYKNIFKLIKENKLWLGYGFKGGAGHFINKHYEDYAKSGNHKEGMIRVSGVHWYTNLEHSKRYDELILWKSYNPEEFPKYANYDAINIDKTAEIPKDYDGLMGVPITFLNQFNPNQFEIICQQNDDERYRINFDETLQIVDKDNKPTNKYMKTNGCLFIPYQKTKKELVKYVDKKGNFYTTPYKRLIIRKK